MNPQKISTIGLVELPSLGLFNIKGKNMLSAETKGLSLVSKQILLSNLQAAGFDAQLIDLRQGTYQEEYGKSIWQNTEYSKVYYYALMPPVFLVVCGLLLLILAT